MTDSPRGVLPPLTSPENHKPQSTAWPQWMQEAFAREPKTENVQKVGGVDEPVLVDREGIRILSRVSPRS